MKKSVFKSNEQRDKFRNYYKQVLSKFPFGQQYINTTFGQTFMLTAGNEANPPIILLHGSCSNSAFWFPEIMALSNNYRVYAVDIIGEAGNSEEYRPDLNSDAFAVWMKEVLEELNIEKAIIIGNSLGGWMALKFAVTFPECVSKLALIASAGLAEVRQEFISNVEQKKTEDGSVTADSNILGNHDLPKEVLDFINLITMSYNPIQYLPVYDDEELQHLNMPVLFIDGENDVIIDGDKSAQRLRNLVSSAEIHLLKNCGHVLTNTMEYIIPFLNKSNQNL
ncbi:MAG: alpha/beta fold hydrolase [Solirubrobacterales bacterium]